MLKRLFLSIAIVCFIGSIAFGVISFSRGYRLNIDKKTLTATGILSISSYPEKASIWINEKLTSATNASISLPPDWYNIRISKEGYQEWKKKIRVQGEIVSQIDALLVPNNPSLGTLTITGVASPKLSPSGSKVAYIVPPESATSSATAKSKNGVWLLEFKSGPLGGKNEAKLLFQPAATYNWENTRLHWSNDEKQIILAFVKKDQKKETVQTAFRISIDKSTPPLNITSSYTLQLKLWQEETKEKNTLQISSNLHSAIADIFARSTNNLHFSPDEMKVFYLATSSATLSQVITPPLIGSNPTEEVRKIEPDKLYVYDIKEDKNFLINDKNSIATPESIIWYSDSKHIVMIEKDTIYIIDYDGTNKRTVYTGPFEENVVYPWPAGNRLVILTNFNKPNALPNFYEIDLR